MEAISRVDRPWGFYEILHEEGTGLRIKRITVYDMQRLSLQSHDSHDEYWFCVSGFGKFTLDDAVLDIYAGATYQILRGEKHRVQSFGGNLVFLEVQSGADLTDSENDITRYEDDYGRI